MPRIGNIKNIIFKDRSKMIMTIIITLTAAALIITACLTRKVITLTVDGHEEKIITHRSTVNSVLLSEKISLNPKDKIWPAINSKIYNKDTIKIKRAVNVNVSADGKKISILSSEENVKSLLKAEGILLGSLDRVEPGIETKLSKDMNINIIRVAVKTLTQNVSIDFKTIIKSNGSMANNKQATIQNGVKGQKQILTNVTYENGKEVSKKTLSEKIIKKSIDKIIVQGTYPVVPLSRGGDMMAYSRIIKVKATAYSAVHGIGKTYTSSGRKAVRNSDSYSTIAVDPNVIPIGTKLFVEGYGFAVAADTGTAIKGNAIDVFFDTRRESSKWAVKYVNVYVLN